jgi:hypothetical protein
VNNLLISDCFLLEAVSKCWSTPINETIPYDLSKAKALYPYSSMAPEYLSGSILSLFSSVCFELITINIISAILPVSSTEYTLSLSISMKINLYFFERTLFEDPAFGQI